MIYFHTISINRTLTLLGVKSSSAISEEGVFNIVEEARADNLVETFT